MDLGTTIGISISSDRCSQATCVCTRGASIVHVRHAWCILLRIERDLKRQAARAIQRRHARDRYTVDESCLHNDCSKAARVVVATVHIHSSDGDQRPAHDWPRAWHHSGGGRCIVLREVQIVHSDLLAIDAHLQP